MENIENTVIQPEAGNPQVVQPLQPEPQQELQPEGQPEAQNQPPAFTFLHLIMRTLAGLGGGIAGSVILLILYLVSASFLAPYLAPAEETTVTSPVFVFVLLAMVFAATLAANLLSPLFISFTQREKYGRITTTMFQIFIMNIVILIVLIPVYFFASGYGGQVVSYAAGLHIVFAILASSLIFEIISSQKYALLGIYSTILAVLGGIAFNAMLYQATGNALVLLFITIPALWGGVGFLYGIFVMLYNWIVATWGTDFLSQSQEYSKDYGIAEEEMIEEEPKEEPKDVEGTDFFNQDPPVEGEQPQEENQDENQS